MYLDKLVRRRGASTQKLPLLPQNTWHLSTRQHTSAYVSIRQHTSAYVSTICHINASAATEYLASLSLSFPSLSSSCACSGLERDLVAHAHAGLERDLETSPERPQVRPQVSRETARARSRHMLPCLPPPSQKFPPLPQRERKNRIPGISLSHFSFSLSTYSEKKKE